MGLIRTKISLSNSKSSSLQPLEVEALVDTGALHLCIPEHIAIQLELRSFTSVKLQLQMVQDMFVHTSAQLK